MRQQDLSYDNQDLNEASLAVVVTRSSVNKYVMVKSIQIE